jgi:predicted enzyme related to lactoylglutathione lyase
MARVVGLGGVFLRSRDPDALYRWYEEHLGISRSADGTIAFGGETAPDRLVVAFFPLETEYFGPVSRGKSAIQGAMLNFCVDDLDGVMERLIASGVPVVPHRETYDYGRFGWFTDPDGNRVELWQPTAAPPSDKP